jgi:alcohol dehydrogenase (cytochrome c)
MRFRARYWLPRALAGLGALAACSSSERSAPTDGARAEDRALRDAMARGESWPSYGRDYTNQRYSPLAQITAANVATLEPAWRYKTGIATTFEGVPLVLGRTMYLSTPLDHLVALDAATGARKWEYAPVLDMTLHCCGAVSRGLAAWGSSLFLGQLDAKLVALDTATGRVVWQTKVMDNKSGYSFTAPAIAVNGLVIIGAAGGEFGARGFVTAYDATTGKERWRFWTIPAPGDAPNGWWGTWRTDDGFGSSFHRDIAQEKADSAKYPDAWKTGGAPVWQAVAVDTALGLVYINTGNAAPNLDGSPRPGDNLYACSIVAVDLATGKYRWHYQEVSHDVWDFDAASPVILLDVKDSTGATIPAAAEAGKTGWVYFVDRRNGRPIRRSEEFVTHVNMFAPTKVDDTVRVTPGDMGGSEWSAHAYSPQTNYLYVLGVHAPILYMAQHEPLHPPAEWWAGIFTPMAAAGTLTAIDVNTGRRAWQVNMKAPLVGGAAATAGGVVFLGTSDNRFIAVDAKTGRELWGYTANAGVNAPPITYAVDGKQYVAVAAGGLWLLGNAPGDELLVFALGGTADTSSTAGKRSSGGGR